MNPISVYKNLLMLVLLTVFYFGGSIAGPLSLQLEDTAGKLHALDDYIGKGKWVVLNIWGPGCPPCREEMPDLVRFHDKHVEQDAMVLGIAIDFPSYGYADKDKVASFMEEYLVDFPVLLSDSSITLQMGLGALQGLPTTFVYTPDGNVAGMQVGAVTENMLDEFIHKQISKRKTQQAK